MEGKVLSANTFELEMDGGLIPQKGRGSLTKLPQLKGYAASTLGVGSKSNGSDAFQFGRSDRDRTGPIWLGSRGRRVCTAAHAGDGVATSGAAYGSSLLA
jgi:hypothetical protein